MGGTISQEQIQAHLSRQEQLIGQLQAVVNSQAKALEKMGTGVDYNAPTKEHNAGLEDIKDELSGLMNAAKAAEKRLPEPPLTEEEKNLPPEDWKEPTEEEERAFAATKPWLGAMAPPSNFQYGLTDAAPDVRLELEHVHGYRANKCRNNINYVSKNEIVYFTAAVGIVHDIATNKQKFFIEHDDDILCQDYHSGRKLVVTGEQGKNPAVCVWDVTTCKLVARMAGFHKRGVTSVAFNKDGSRIVTVGLDNEHSIAVYDWATGAIVAQAKGGTDRVLNVIYNWTEAVDTNNAFVTIGVKHIVFWTQIGSTLEDKKGLLGNLGERQTFLSIGFTTLYTCIGTGQGEIYVFKDNKLQKVIDAHQKSVFSLRAHGDTMYSGGKDGYVSTWNMNTMKKTASVNLNKLIEPEVLKNATNHVRAIDYSKGKLIVGTITSAVYTIDTETNAAEKVFEAHYGDLESEDNYGELWGLATSPNANVYVSAGQDGTLRVWDIAERKQVRKIMLKDKAQSVAWSPNGAYFAVGLDGGSVVLHDAKTYEEIKSVRKCKRRIQCVRFSPDSKTLAVGSADNVIDLYDITQDMKHIERIRGNSSVILHLDFSEDGKQIQSCSQSYELLFYEADTGKQITNSRSLNDVQWATFSSILGWNVQGIWPAEADGSDINQVNKSNSNKYLASAEDSGLVKVFQYPCVGGGLDRTGKLNRRPESVSGKGHSSHVTSVEWSRDDKYLLSTGGGDLSVFQWKVVKA